jgi:adenine-specific DNA methylase
MKFMGSKRWMLQNGLGDLVAREVKGAGRFVDLFAGSSAVTAHVATKYRIPVAAYDLQMFSTILARAILNRKSEINVEHVWANWYRQAKQVWETAGPPPSATVNRATVTAHREWCATQAWSLTRSYGGYYFSASQTVWLDALRRTLPAHEPERSVALAALIRTASRCAAAPGHTAQPFQPTRRAKPFLMEAWLKDIVSKCRVELSAVSRIHAKMPGVAEVADANDVAQTLSERDLVFVDPPYSGVHYSRFYHVLETLARGECAAVSGNGRYPPIEERPHSRYSVSSESAEALRNLFKAVSCRGASHVPAAPMLQRPIWKAGN